MTKPLRQAVEIILYNLPAPKKILEIGSKQEKNQKGLANLRRLFPVKKTHFIGVDIRKGAGVDTVANAEKLPFKNNSFDLIFCLETLEHSPKPWLIAKEIERVLQNKGVVIASSQQNFPLHLHPSDYFRFTPYGLSSLFINLPQKLLFSISPPFDNEVKLNPQTVVMVGWKGKGVKDKIKKGLLKNKHKISVHKPYRHRLADGIKIIKRGLNEAVFKQEIAFF